MVIRRIESVDHATWVFCVVGSSRKGWLANNVMGCASSHEAMINKPGIALARTNQEACNEKKT